ncbi:hypothetical protein SmJEL517_g03576 [Synchytrium microbalum]|uniref:RING-type domain-containing protein n=1 Tax=Synchytrium microbalum TaxID=1806994 RepID=A0A507C2H1_9FUNG|nr:uncharacterized protein SmJEL517_g03576 [Synchytrium microbalum]TPX33621.1 hypothetical protein SmJEL517_g03576 [Synchytrium microbalum]
MAAAPNGFIDGTGAGGSIKNCGSQLFPPSSVQPESRDLPELPSLIITKESGVDESSPCCQRGDSDCTIASSGDLSEQNPANLPASTPQQSVTNIPTRLPPRPPTRPSRFPWFSIPRIRRYLQPDDESRPSRRARREARRMREARLRASMLERSGETPDKRTWLLARIIACAELVALGVLTAASVWALVNDWGSICDTKVYAFLAVDAVFLFSQMVLDLCIVVCAPRESLWTWENHKRAEAVSVVFLIKMVFIFTQAVLTLTGMGLVKTMDSSCESSMPMVADTAFWSCFAQFCLFMCVGLPAWCLPCLGILVEVPDIGGANPDILFRIKPIIMGTNADPNHQDCAICLNKMDEATKLPCRHAFHHGCIEQWWLERDDCPCCRQTFNNLRRWGNRNSNSAGLA